MALSRARGTAMALTGDGGRSVLVLSHDRELAVALRERLDRALVTVREVWPDEALAAVRACRPWPWLVVGDIREADPALTRLLASRPTLLVWRGAPPPGLPPQLRAARLFSEIVEAVEAALGAVVGGVRLAVGSGLTMPDGGHAANPVLEALVAGHPHPIRITAGHLRTAIRTLSVHAVPLRAWRGPDGAVLVEASA